MSDSTVRAPVLCVVEAKKDDIYAGEGQCGATMEGIRRFNQKKGKNLPHIWGIISTGFDWRFLKLKDEIVYLDKKIYTTDGLPILLGALQYMVEN